MAFERPFLDGFDHYSTAEILTKWNSVSSQISISTAQARTGNRSLLIGSSGSLLGVTKILDIQARTLVIGFAMYSLVSSSSSSRYWPLRLRAGSDTQVALVLNGNFLEVRRGDATVLGVSDTAISTGAWNYIELRVYIDSTNGEWDLRINGITTTSGNGNTQGAGVNTIDRFRFDSAGSADAGYIDDLYVRCATGYEAGGFFGDCKVLTRLPDGAGSAAQLTSSSGNPNWQNVNTALPDLATYNHSLTPGDKDLYDFAALNDPGAIRAVQANFLANKSDAGLRLIVPRIKSGATEEAGTAQALSTDERYYTRSWEVDPATGAAFTAAGLDACEFGASVDE